MSRVILESGKVADVVAIYGADNTASTSGNIRLFRLGADGRVMVESPDYEIDKVVDAGDAFKADYTASVATNATLNMIWETTASTKYSHFELDIYASQGNVDIKLYEATARSEATTVTVYNRNRLSSTTSSTTAGHSATAVTTGSTVLHAGTIANAAQKHEIPKIKLNVSSLYYLILTPTCAGANVITVNSRWVDHTAWS